MDKIEIINRQLDEMLEALDEALTTSADDSLLEGTVQEVVAIVDGACDDANGMMESSFVDEIDKNIDELYSESESFMEAKNIVRLNRNAVLSQLVGLFSIIIGRRKNQREYKLFKKFALGKKKMKKLLKQKNQALAVQAARKYIKRRKFKG